MGASGGFQDSHNHQAQNQWSGTQFPTDFAAMFGQTFGNGTNFQELLNGLPRSQGLFGGAPVGIFPTQGQAGGGGYPPSPGQPAPQGQPGGAGIGLPGGGGGGMPPQQAGPQPIAWNDVVTQINQLSPNQPERSQKYLDGLQRGAAALGIAPGSALTPEQLRQISANVPGNKPAIEQFLAQFVPAQQAAQQSLAPGDPRFAASGSSIQGFDVAQGLQNLGFGQAPPQATTPGMRDAPTINSPMAAFQQANIAPQGFEQFGQDLYNSQYQPVARELGRQGDIADERLRADLAGAGLSTSGSGVGQLQQQRRERGQQLQAASEDAANRAATQRFGMQYQQELDNAQMRTQTALANAGFSLQAQTQNAQNVLAGDTAKADAYLRTFGMNQDTANAARQSFLGAAGLAEQDLARMDGFQQQTLGLLLNNWLQQFGALTAAGQTSQGASQGEGRSFGFQQSGGISG